MGKDEQRRAFWIADCRDNYIAACRAASAALRFGLGIAKREEKSAYDIKGRPYYTFLRNEPNFFGRLFRCKSQ